MSGIYFIQYDSDIEWLYMRNLKTICRPLLSDLPVFMTTSRRFKCVPQILGSLSIHIFMLLFLLITYS